MSEITYKHLFGPVPSRRLGRSLGIDLVPLKTCSYNCLYCQLGPSATTLERKEYVPVAEVLGELAKWLKAGEKCDYLTFSGSGEPTLHSGIGKIITGIKGLTRGVVADHRARHCAQGAQPGIPLAVITNGSLLYRAEVRDELMTADIVLPSLDAADEEAFLKLNRPAENISFEAMLDGLRQFSLDYRGDLWLEVFLLAGVNDSDEHIEKLAALLGTISHDKVQLNTVSRPPGEKVEGVSVKRLEQIRERLGEKAELVAGGDGGKRSLGAHRAT